MGLSECFFDRGIIVFWTALTSSLEIIALPYCQNRALHVSEHKSSRMSGRVVASAFGLGKKSFATYPSGHHRIASVCGSNDQSHGASRLQDFAVNRAHSDEVLSSRYRFPLIFLQARPQRVARPTRLCRPIASPNGSACESYSAELMSIECAAIHISSASITSAAQVHTEW